MEDGLIRAAMEIAEKRAALQRMLREAILADDLALTLKSACELVGLSEKEAEDHIRMVRRKTYQGPRLVEALAR